MKKSKKIKVQGFEIAIISKEESDYISLTDMLRAKDGDFFISDWLRNRNTVEFLGIWEKINNSNSNYGEFAIIKSQAGLNSYKISVKDWVEKTKAIGLKAKAGRYGGTYAHKDIAFEFGMWISPVFPLFNKEGPGEILSINIKVKHPVTKIEHEFKGLREFRLLNNRKVVGMRLVKSLFNSLEKTLSFSPAWKTQLGSRHRSSLGSLAPGETMLALACETLFS